MLPSIADAHTHLSSSNPAEGQVVVEDLKEITLTFDGAIEKLSTMKLLKDGNEIPALQVQIEGTQIMGILSEQLENGEYLIQWNISGEDGHPIAGEIPFTVQTAETGVQQSTSTSEPDANTPTSNQDDSIEQATTIKDDQSKANGNESTKEENNSFNRIIYFLGFIIIFGFGLLLVRKKR